MLYFIMVFCAGVALSLQAPINASLAKGLYQSPVLAACISFCIGTICLLILSRFFHQLSVNHLRALGTQEWWKMLGGALGAFVVFTTIFCAPKIGLAPMIIVLLFGQLTMGMILDYFGMFGLIQRAITWEKILGLMTIVCGIIVFFWRDLKGIRGI